MSRDARLLNGRGFVVLSRRPAFIEATIGRYLALDPQATHVVLVHHDDTDPETLAGVIRAAGAAVGVEVHPVRWADYGAPDNVRRVAALPSERLVFVSVDHRRTLADRLDPRRGYIRRTAARKKIVVDAVPYEVAPWRTFFPFAFFDRDLLGYHHSYALEQDYERFLDGGLADNPCDAGRLVEKTWPAAIVDEPAYFTTRPTVTWLPASPADRVAYLLERDKLFDSEKSIASVKAKLSRWIQGRYPTRALPIDLKRCYGTLPSIVATDLPFDRWQVGEVLGLMNHTDAMLRGYVERQRAAGEGEP